MDIKTIEMLANHAIEGVLITDCDKKIIYTNDAFTAITGYHFEDVAGQNPGVLKAKSREPEFYINLWQSVEQQGFWKGELWNRKKCGLVYRQLITIIKVDRHESDRVYVAIFHDLARPQTGLPSQHPALNEDVLTGFIDREEFRKLITWQMKVADASHSDVHLVKLDLGEIQTINDSFDHNTCDQIIMDAASRLRKMLPKACHLARLGPDEFGILCPQPFDLDATLQLIESLIQELSKPYIIKATQISLMPSVGCAIYPHDADTPESLMRCSRTALEFAKRSGRNCFALYDKSMTEIAREKLLMVQDLKQALKSNQLFVVLQPKVDMRSGLPEGAEVLLRWNHPNKGMIPPSQFIPLAEEAGLITEVSHWVLAETLTIAKHLYYQQGISLPIALNLCAQDINNKEFIEHVINSLRAHKLPSDMLEVEVTETMLVENSDTAHLHLQQLRDAGIKVSMDDFGTGYSSLSHLRDLPIDRIKIDRSFVVGMTADRVNQGIIKLITDLAKLIGVEILAEGVETEQQKLQLIELKCFHAQGYLFQRPLILEDYIQYLHSFEHPAPVTLQVTGQVLA